MKQRKGLELLRHMVQQVEAHTPNAERLRFSCSIEIARDIAEELAGLERFDREDHTQSVIRRRLKRGQAPLVPGDRVYGCTIVNVYTEPTARGLAWVATTP